MRYFYQPGDIPPRKPSNPRNVLQHPRGVKIALRAVCGLLGAVLVVVPFLIGLWAGHVLDSASETLTLDLSQCEVQLPTLSEE